MDSLTRWPLASFRGKDWLCIVTRNTKKKWKRIMIICGVIKVVMVERKWRKKEKDMRGKTQKK